MALGFGAHLDVSRRLRAAGNRHGFHPRQRDQIGDPHGCAGRFGRLVTWSILEWIRAVTSLPIVVKGIMSPDDARLAVENGAAGVIVSNHAARLFDGPITTIEALPYVVDAVGGRCEVYLDGGVRRGIDVLKALALGARACLIGKPLFYALAVDGENGVRRIFEILKNELDFAMAMCGVRTIDDIDPSLVTRPELGAF